MISRPGRDRMAPTRCDVLVIGGGITGCSTAWHLAGYGAEVVVLEQFDLNTQASGRNAGSLHGQIQHSSFLEFGEEWAHGFLPALLFLSESLEMWKTLSEVLDTDLEVSLNGGLLVAETDAQMRDIERKVAIERSAGVESDMLGPADLRRYAPYISEVDGWRPALPGGGKGQLHAGRPCFCAGRRVPGSDDPNQYGGDSA